MVLPLGKPVSDHIPCVVAIESNIPKSKLFQFENYWVNHEGFSDVVARSWSKPCHAPNSTALICKKMKNLRYELKRWSRGISKLKTMIQNSNEALAQLDNLEDKRALFIQEKNFRRILKLHLDMLLKYQNDYWRKRCTVRYSRFADENTKLFQSLTTERFRQNSIANLRDGDVIVSGHIGKEGVLYKTYKERLGSSKPTPMCFNLSWIIRRIPGLDELSVPFSKEEIDAVIK